MEKKVLETLQLLNANMEKGFNEINNRIGSLENEVSTIKTDVHDLKVDVNDFKKEMTAVKSEISSINTRLDGIDKRMAGIASHFEVISENIIETREKQNQDAKYLKYKVGQIEQDVFLLNPKQ